MDMPFPQNDTSCVLSSVPKAVRLVMPEAPNTTNRPSSGFSANFGGSAARPPLIPTNVGVHPVD